MITISISVRKDYMLLMMMCVKRFQGLFDLTQLLLRFLTHLCWMAAAAPSGKTRTTNFIHLILS